MTIRCWLYGHVSLLDIDPNSFTINNTYNIKLCDRCKLLFWEKIAAEQDD